MEVCRAMNEHRQIKVKVGIQMDEEKQDARSGRKIRKVNIVPRSTRRALRDITNSLRGEKNLEKRKFSLRDEPDEVTGTKKRMTFENHVTYQPREDEGTVLSEYESFAIELSRYGEPLDGSSTQESFILPLSKCNIFV